MLKTNIFKNYEVFSASRSFVRMRINLNVNLWTNTSHLITFSHLCPCVYIRVRVAEIELKVKHSGEHALFLNLDVIKNGISVYNLSDMAFFPFVLFVCLIHAVTFPELFSIQQRLRSHFALLSPLKLHYFLPKT